MLYPLFRNIAFRFDPERVHNLTFSFFHLFPRLMASIIPGIKANPSRYSLSLNGLNWPFPVGTAAGLDKEAVAVEFLARLGFGSVEVGTVTAKPQPGNPKPRIFRYPHLYSIRNTMGFPNSGMLKIAQNLKSCKLRPCIGVNLGKNKNTLEHEAHEEYRILYKTFAPIADYLVINVSSPNTPGLRNLQSEIFLRQILLSLESERNKCASKLFVKIAPDLTFKEAEAILSLALEFKLSGLVATNTTLIPEIGQGGISGALLYEKSRKLQNHLLSLIKENPDFEIIGVGGFFNFNQILDFWNHGGKLVQIYTSFIYRGPEILQEVKSGIDRILDQEKADSLQELFDRNYFLN